mgnify:CR=1 FL=1
MLAAGLHLIDMPLGARRNTAYLVEGADSLLVFDTGIAGQLEQHLVPYLAEIGRSPDEIGTVVVSHCDIDHWGGAADIRRIAPAARILAHELDAVLIGNTDRTIADRYQEFVAEHGIGWSDDFLALQHERSAPVTVDELVEDGHVVDLGGRTVELLHVPGHSAGHLALWDESTLSLLIADALLGDGVPDFAGHPAMPPNYRYPADYLATCERLGAYGADLLLSAHFAPRRGAEVGRFVAASARYTAYVEGELLGALAGLRSATTLELVRALQPALGPWPVGEVDFGVASMLVGHLEDWAAAGRVTRSTGLDGLVVWTASAPPSPGPRP